MMKITPVSVSIEDAAAWIGRWQLSDHHLKAMCFTFGADEFRALLEEKHVHKVRLYVALAELPDGKFREKLLVIGVDKHGGNIINPKRKKEFASEDEHHGDDGTGIYDFSHPCPPICG